jgi:hypothetical protein
MTAPRPSRILIYGLIDPRQQCLRYIGKTHKRREIRLQEHIEAAQAGETAHVYRWLRALLKSGHLPDIFVLERVPGTESWEEAERRQIAFWRAPRKINFPYTHPTQTRKSVPTLIRAAKLTNMHDGGAVED